METYFLHYPDLTYEQAWESPEPSAIAIGVFDGVHRGHQAVIQQALALARRHDLVSTVFTFVEHPQAVIRPDHPVPLLTPWAEKQRRLEELGIERLIGVHFTPAFARLSPEDFAQKILLEQLQAKCICVGERFSFGHKSAGNAAQLRKSGLQVVEVPPICDHETIISSSRIRKLLGEGHIQEANALLGYSYRLSGEVVTGDQRGRLLGFPTANLAVPEHKLIPAFGVYSGWVDGPMGRYPCVVNIGQSPTFDPPELKIEAHLLGFSGDLYGQCLTVELKDRIRGEVAFSHVEQLVEQIRQDVSWARQQLSSL